ncbi:MAG: cell division protein FtsZ [Gammaproteobacteria bacterium]|jgi:cell division protein FtsZ
MFELIDSVDQNAIIKVIGVGGGGGNAVTHMINAGIEGVDFICANTDAQALRSSKIKTALQIGGNITKGLGAGADPDVGRQAAMEDRDRIMDVIDGSDMLFITAGMGGGTGTGAAPIVAQVARECGVLTVAVVTKPFMWEGGKRMRIAETGICELAKYVDSLITIPNEKLLAVLGAQVSLMDAFKSANQVLQGAVQGIADLITRPGLINVDFADVRTVMSEMGMAMMGTGTASGDNRAREAAEAAMSSPLLEDIDLTGANGILVNVTAGPDMSIGDFHEVGQTVEEFSSDDATVVVGTVIDPEMSNQIRVTVVATGLGRPTAAAEPKIQLVDRPQRVVNGAGYEDLDRPTVLRKRQQQTAVQSEDRVEHGELLDIPAFLRRQAD